MIRGEQVTAQIGEQPACSALLLDQGPDGWWVYLEDRVDDRGYPLIVQVPAQDLRVAQEGLF